MTYPTDKDFLPIKLQAVVPGMSPSWISIIQGYEEAFKQLGHLENATIGFYGVHRKGDTWEAIFTVENEKCL